MSRVDLDPALRRQLQSALPDGFALSRGGLRQAEAAIRDGVEIGVVETIIFRAGHEVSIANKRTGGRKVGNFGVGRQAFGSLAEEAKASRQQAILGDKYPFKR